MLDVADAALQPTRRLSLLLLWPLPPPSPSSPPLPSLLAARLLWRGAAAPSPHPTRLGELAQAATRLWNLRASFAAGPGEDIAPSSCRSIESSSRSPAILQVMPRRAGAAARRAADPQGSSSLMPPRPA